MFRESFLDGLQADLSQPIPWTSAFSFHLRLLGKEHWWSVPNTAGPFPMSCLSFASAPPNIKKIQVDKYARWREEGRDRERLREGGFQGWGRRQGELPHILCVTGNSLWILSRFCSARPSVATLPRQSYSLYIPYTSRGCTPPLTCFLVLLWLSILPRPIPVCGWALRFQAGCWRRPKPVPEPPQDSNYLYSVFF